MAYQADLIVDTRGLNCPMPVIKTKKEMNKLKSGQIIEVLGTDPGSAGDMNGWCKQTGHTLLESNEVEMEGEKVFQFFIQVK